jgi:hypothetical protein
MVKMNRNLENIENFVDMNAKIVYNINMIKKPRETNRNYNTGGSLYGGSFLCVAATNPLTPFLKEPRDARTRN